MTSGHHRQQRLIELEDLASAAALFREISSRSVDRCIACEKSANFRMLKRVAAHEANAATSGSYPPKDPFHRTYLASKKLMAAIRSADNVEIMRWLCCEYCPRVVPVEAMGEAAKCNRLGVFQWLCERYRGVHPNIYIAVKATEGGHLAMLQWILSRSDYTSHGENGWPSRPHALATSNRAVGL